MIRITSDIDSKSKIKILFYTAKALFIIKRLKRIELKKSYSGNHHLIIWTTYPYKVKEQFRLRLRIGDDRHRVSMDRLRRFGRNTLFNTKKQIKILK
jgi:hypothetical protein